MTRSLRLPGNDDLGTTFQWYWDQKTRTVRIRFDDDMLVRALRGNKLVNLRFRMWTLAFGEKSGDGYRIKETVPGHDYELPVRHLFEIFLIK